MGSGSGDLAVGLVLVLVGVWLFARTWFGGLPRTIAKGVF